MNRAVKNYSFDNEDFGAALTKQAIHMDQGTCYNPEYLAVRQVSLYPSRVAQIIRAVYLGELKASRRGAEIVFSSILSGQGERWQNFSEPESDFLHCLILGRELFAERGLSPIAHGESLDVKASPGRDAFWKESITLRPDGDCHLFIDDASFEYTGGAPSKLGKFLEKKGVKVSGYSSSSTGFAPLAHGFVGEGIKLLSDLVERLKATKARKVMTVSGQGKYALTVLTDIFGIRR
ncbi:MAG: hypothetical protein LBK91_00395, partial [Synergistaceae bacterium]|nr:hypothetical protein [Synergistaceae bacterium]